MKFNKRHIKSFILASALICCGAIPAFAEPGGAEAPSTQVIVNQPQIRVVGSQVEITVAGQEDVEVTIYALTGQIIKSLTVAPGTTMVDLSKGYYIVKCDRISCRVVVK